MGNQPRGEAGGGEDEDEWQEWICTLSALMMPGPLLQFYTGPLQTMPLGTEAVRRCLHVAGEVNAEDWVIWICPWRGSGDKAHDLMCSIILIVINILESKTPLFI